MSRSWRALMASSDSPSCRVSGERVRPGDGHLDQGPVDRQRGAQLVRGVGDEPALAVEGAVQPLQHGVERVGQLLDLVARAGQRDPLVQPAAGAVGPGDPPRPSR